MNGKHPIKLVVAHRFRFVALRRPVVAVDVCDHFPERMLLDFARRPFQRRADRYDFRSSEASVVVKEPVCWASAGIPFPTGSSFGAPNSAVWMIAKATSTE